MACIRGPICPRERWIGGWELTWAVFKVEQREKLEVQELEGDSKVEV